jgi:hypothetical protein
VDLSVQIGSLKLANPLMAASGCYGYGVEYADAVDLSSLGAVVSKGLFLKPREGHPPERIVETPSGMLNAIGLQGIGVHRYIAEKLPELRRLGATNVINICGSTLDEYVELARILSDAEGVHALELNISCPNIKEGDLLGDLRHPRRRQRSESHAPARHPQTDAERHGRRLDRRCRDAADAVRSPTRFPRWPSTSKPDGQCFEHRRRSERSRHPAIAGAWCECRRAVKIL